ncbi:MAG: DinB family protein [Saprospiraceae bacterium]|nr:DinB family protein [Saprospiraceae bacterium]MCB0626615.1 DinB family protein [Saprospiraceae bacterium]MCB0679574.1 DinB family protein [Saprospiraceae bacterium]
MHPSLQDPLQELDAELAQLLAELKNYTHQQLNSIPSPGSWSAIQVMHHLLIAEELSFKYLQKKLSFNPSLQKANWRTRLRQSFLAFYLHTPIKFKAPKGVSTPAFPREATLIDTAKRWTSNREALAEYLNELPPEILDKEAYRHPIAGRLTVKGMLSFFRDHFDRHRKQINRTLDTVARQA